MWSARPPLTLTVGDAPNNWIEPGAGNDTVSGGTNTPVLVGAQSGGDTVDYTDATAGVAVDLTAGTSTGGSGTDTLSGIENVVGGAASDAITGDIHSNLLRGGGGNDLLKGGPGDDVTADYFDGGSGIDTVSYADNTLPTNVDLASNSAVSGSSGLDLIGASPAATVENAILGSGNDVFSGSTFNNQVWPNGGRNTLGCEPGGCGGIDTVNYSMGYTKGVTVNLSGGGQDSITGFTNVIGTAFDDTLIGSDTTFGTDGANLLVGGKGNDTSARISSGGDGNDRPLLGDDTSGQRHHPRRLGRRRPRGRQR